MPLSPQLMSLLANNGSTPASRHGLGPIGQGYVKFVEDAWNRAWRIGPEYFGRGIVLAIEALLGRDGGTRLMREMYNGSINYMMEMAEIMPFSAIIGRSEWEKDRAQSGKPTLQAKVEHVDGKPIMLPIRFDKATQGWALYLVDPREAQDQLGDYAKDYEIWQVDGRAMLVIYAVDFKATDLGPYREVGVEFWVRPRHDPLAMPGTVVTRMSVDEKWSVDAAGHIWSFIKLLAPNMTPSYHHDSVMFPVDDKDPNTLAITLPRFGTQRTTDVPIRYFTVGRVDADDKAQNNEPLCTIFHRSTAGEGMQFDGNVKVRLGDGKGDHCFCAIDPKHKDPRVCTCDGLRRLGLPDMRPVANGWTEHMSGTVSPPYALLRR